VAKQPETRFKERVWRDLKALKSKGLPIHFRKIQQVCINGTPDILLCVNGRAVDLELKAGPRSRVSRLQRWEMKQTEKAGGLAFLAWPEIWPDVLRKLVDLCIKEP
jgi:hypothetical protein